MILDGSTGLGVLAIAGPEHTHLPLDLLVGYARVVCDPAFAGDPQLVEDLARMGEGEALSPAQRGSDVLNDPPILPCVPWRVDRLVDLYHPALDLRHGS